MKVVPELIEDFVKSSRGLRRVEDGNVVAGKGFGMGCGGRCKGFAGLELVNHFEQDLLQELVRGFLRDHLERFHDRDPSLDEHAELAREKCITSFRETVLRVISNLRMLVCSLRSIGCRPRWRSARCAALADVAFSEPVTFAPFSSIAL